MSQSHLPIGWAPTDKAYEISTLLPIAATTQNKRKGGAGADAVLAGKATKVVRAASNTSSGVTSARGHDVDTHHPPSSQPGNMNAAAHDQPKAKKAKTTSWPLERGHQGPPVHVPAVPADAKVAQLVPTLSDSEQLVQAERQVRRMSHVMSMPAKFVACAADVGLWPRLGSELSRLRPMQIERSKQANAVLRADNTDLRAENERLLLAQTELQTALESAQTQARHTSCHALAPWRSDAKKA